MTVYAREGVAYTDSRNVADVFEKGHGNVLRLIDGLREGLIQNDLTPWFIERHERNPQNGQLYRRYEMTRDGAVLLDVSPRVTGARPIRLTDACLIIWLRRPHRAL